MSTTEKGFWQKLNTTAKVIGQGVVDKALQLYYAAESAETPGWVKVIIYSALAYLIAPLDAIPDFLPGASRMIWAYWPVRYRLSFLSSRLR